MAKEINSEFISVAESLSPQGIQIVGTQRSGSNLLRVILDQSADIASPHPPHILVTFGPLMSKYEPLTKESYQTLVSDVVDFVNANPVPWEGVVLDKEAIFKASERYTLFDLNRHIYEAAANAKNARYWCCKSMANVHYAEELERYGTIDKYIFLYRDGRDVAASFKKAVVGDKHTYFLARQWKEDQEACLSLASQLDPERFFALNYETLISEPERTVKELCAFLDIAYNEEMLNFHTSNSSKITAAAGEMWANLEKPIMSDNTGKFLKSFQEGDLEIFEMVAGKTLQKLGYPLYTSMDNSELISEESLKKYQEQNSLLKKEILTTVRKSDLEKREPQQVLLDAIKNR
ncbi:sulfotransferase [Dyadobacter sp. CY312]|uniref:sulfotransferase family protein n=1 Tax=Dyadobacter sp. CY312 TaxID=2907303 RepID=UPI001F1E134C|nr:sulfotransferase [Dyadobacter sp. CY312]MCE7038955.1 sulfotransferase [Dyadobacter sp. CY312]